MKMKAQLQTLSKTSNICGNKSFKTYAQKHFKKACSIVKKWKRNSITKGQITLNEKSTTLLRFHYLQVETRPTINQWTVKGHRFQINHRVIQFQDSLQCRHTDPLLTWYRQELFKPRILEPCALLSQCQLNLQFQSTNKDQVLLH